MITKKKSGFRCFSRNTHPQHRTTFGYSSSLSHAIPEDFSLTETRARAGLSGQNSRLNRKARRLKIARLWDSIISPERLQTVAAALTGRLHLASAAFVANAFRLLLLLLFFFFFFFFFVGVGVEGYPSVHVIWEPKSSKDNFDSACVSLSLGQNNAFVESEKQQQTRTTPTTNQNQNKI